MMALVALSLLQAQEDPRKLAVDRNPDARIRAVRAFSERPDPEAVRALIPFLADSHPKVRLRTAKALSRLKDLDSIDFLVRMGLRHANGHVRAGACEALGKAGVGSAINGLVSRLRDPHPEVRSRAAEALGMIGDASVEEALIDAFRRRSEPRPRKGKARQRRPGWIRRSARPRDQCSTLALSSFIPSESAASTWSSTSSNFFPPASANSETSRKRARSSILRSR